MKKIRLPKLSKAKYAVLICSIGVIVILAGALYQYQESSKVSFGNHKISLETVSSESKRSQGLSGRENLDENTGMLFVFEQPGLHCFWMKDMKFPIDILWLDVDKKVIDIRPSVEPSTYPAQFCPAQNASYVIEVQAGRCANSGVDIGTHIRF